MTSLLETTLYSLRSVLVRRTQRSEPWQSRYPDILSSLESVIDATDSRIRLVSGYRKKLVEAIRTSLEFTDELVGRIPAPIEVGRSTFVSDPYVNAFFASVTDLQTIFSQSSEVREFLEACGNSETSYCYALLCMHKEEKVVMGMELSGDVLRKDVSQIAVNFTDHRIYSPAPSEEATREGLKQCLFGGLVTNALERIVQHKLAAHRLQNERRVLHGRLRHFEQKMKTVGIDGELAELTARDIEEMRQRLSRIEAALMDARPASPLESLQRVHAVFSEPEAFVRMTKHVLALDRMGIRINDDSAQPCNKIDLTEVEIGDAAPRVVTLAKFPRGELLPLSDFSLQRMYS
jgi:exonuclease VII large subunit